MFLCSYKVSVRKKSITVLIKTIDISVLFYLMFSLFVLIILSTYIPNYISTSNVSCVTFSFFGGMGVEVGGL